MNLTHLIFTILLISCAHAQGPLLNLGVIKEKYELPGLGLAVIKDYKLKSIEVAGTRKLGEETPLLKTDLFHLGSNSKAMTATLIAKLVDEKKLSFDSKLGDFFDKKYVNNETAEITIEELITHTSGLKANTSDYQDILNLNKVEALKSPAKARKYLVHKILRKAKLGEKKFHYSNIGFITLGHIIEIISQRTFEQTITEKLFKPLNMSSCGFGIAAKNIIPADQPWGHHQATKRPVLDDNPSFYASAGTIYCSLEDWSKFILMHLKGYKGEHNYLLKPTFQKIFSERKDSEYTLGAWFRLKRMWAKGPAFTHTGSNTYQFSNLWFAPEIGAAYLSVSNIAGENAHTATNEAISIAIKNN